MKLQKIIIALIGSLILFGFKAKFTGPEKFARFEVQIEKVNNEKIKGYLIAA